MLPETGIEPLDSYCKSVKNGDISVCGWVEKAVDRHYMDLHSQRTKEFPYYFEPEAARHYVNFFRDYLRHYEGAISGDPIVFEPWQWFVYGSIFGWLKVDRYKDVPIRRFRNAIIIIPKKNGKSIISGGTGLYMMDWDGWPGAQCYILAKNQTHAMDLGYRAAVNMVEKSDFLNERYKINRGAMNMGVHYPENNNAFYKPITSKPDSEDGRNVHFCGPDETKDWTDFEIYDLMKNGTVNAPNSLFMSTTTAGYNQEALGFHQQKYIEKVLGGVVQDEATFGIIYGIDEEDTKADDYWLDEDLWEKANPNYGVSVIPDVLRSIANEAKGSPSKINAFKCKHLNQWVSSKGGFVTAEIFSKCSKEPVTLEMLAARKCIAALDLGEVVDLTSFVVLGLPEEGQDYLLKVWRWIPEDTLRERKNAETLMGFIRDGFIKATKGNATDFDEVEEDIIQVLEAGLGIEHIVFDPNKGQQIPQHLAERGIEPVSMAQTYRNLNPGVDEMERAILAGQFNYGDDKMLEWSNSNIVIATNRDGYRKFDKKEAQDKIDDMVAAEMAFAWAAGLEEESQDYYDGDFVAV